MKCEKKNLLVLFPGTGYTVNSPLLYYADFKYYQKGYESIKINYGNSVQKDTSWDEVVENAKNCAYKQMKDIAFSKYADILFVSKSLGTVAAGWVADELGIGARHIYLTPINGTLQYIKNDKNISVVVAGTKDDLMDIKILIEHCKREDIQLELIENAEHSLEVIDDVDTNIDVLKHVVSLY